MNGLSVLICTANRPAWLTALLRSLADDPTRPPHIALVVVDNSADGSAAAVLQGAWPFPIEHAHLPEPSIANARNLAISLARTDTLLLLDDDQFVGPGFFSALDRRWRGRPAWSSGLRLQVLAAPEPGANPRYFAAPTTRLHNIHPVTRAEFATNGLVITRSALLALGRAPFDDHFGLTGGEDTDIFVRLTQLGTRIAYCSDVIVHERVPRARATLLHVVKTGFRTGMTDAMIALRCEGRGRLDFATDSLGQLIQRLIYGLGAPLVGVTPQSKGLVQVARFAGKTFAILGGRWEPYRPSARRPA